MSFQEAYKIIKEYNKNYEVNLVIDFPSTNVVFLQGRDIGIIAKSVCTADTCENACIKLATRIQDGLI